MKRKIDEHKRESLPCFAKDPCVIRRTNSRGSMGRILVSSQTSQRKLFYFWPQSNSCLQQMLKIYKGKKKREEGKRRKESKLDLHTVEL